MGAGDASSGYYYTFNTSVLLKSPMIILICSFGTCIKGFGCL